MLAMRVARRDRGLHLPARGVRDALAHELSRALDEFRAAGLLDGLSLELVIGAGALHRRRGDGDARVDGGPPRDAAAQASVPEPGGLPRPADADPERRDARPHPGDPPERRRVVGGARDAERDGDAALVGRPARSASPAATRPPNGVDDARSSSTSTRAGSPTRSAPSCPGGAASGILPPSALDAPLTRDGLREYGAGPGSAAVQVFPASYSPLRLLAGDDALLRRGVVPEVHAVPDRQPRAPPPRRGARERATR